MKRWAIVIAAAVSLLSLSPSAFADAQDVARRVAQEVISPYCPGVTLHDCPSSEGDAMRREILDMAESGMSHDEIIDALVAERGEEILATPSNPIARLLPLTLLVLAAVGGATLITRWGRRRTPGIDTGPSISSADHARVEMELERLRTSDDTAP